MKEYLYIRKEINNMRNLDYQDVTIEECLNLYAGGIDCKCDADKFIVIMEE